MQTTRRDLLAAALPAAVLAQTPTSGVTRYVRFQQGAAVRYGILDGDRIRVLRGGLFDPPKEAGSAKLADVTLLYPIQPPKVLAVGLNYKSHIGNRPAPKNCEIFFKPTTCLQNPGAPIVIPATSKNTHYEGELVIIVGRRASKVTDDQAHDVIFGVTCGNDVSERDWQGGPEKDLQWWRAKGADTFGPLGPVIARGLNYGNLQLQTRLNGDVVQKANTDDLLFNCHQIVSAISQYVTLEQGDIIYTGTPGSTRRMQPGDKVEVEIEGVGVLANPVVAA
jgi:2-keto-4-pentenoate hydratase/2-oxohepta-3-ene-1,7-dioic acid hydratase in catechol pathway